uniref:B box-type domain-containing protein n=1 Tax=Trichogramma kaykai TaxID=54128 RepID=A0ABD2WH70_9HYME
METYDRQLRDKDCLSLKTYAYRFRLIPVYLTISEYLTGQRQALCTNCKDKTHQAKMFSRHQILVMDKRLRDNQKRCLAHGEVYIMFNQSDQVMLCATCFREMSPDTRLHCIDINSAWQRISEKMKRAINSMCEIQTEMHKEIQDLKSQQDNLQCNINVTKLKLDTYVKDLKKAVDKTHDAIMNGLLHEFHDKQGSMQSRVASLTSILPILKMHLGLCISFMSTADKYQFLELAHTVLERLNRVGQLGHFPQIPIILTSQNDKFKIEFMNALYPFISHFDSDTDMETHFHQYEKKQNQKQSKIHTLRMKQSATPPPFFPILS